MATTLALVAGLVSTASCKTPSGAATVKDAGGGGGGATDDADAGSSPAVVSARNALIQAVDRAFGTQRQPPSTDPRQVGQWSFAKQKIAIQAIHTVVIPAKPDANGFPTSVKVLIVNGSSNRNNVDPTKYADVDNAGLYDPDTNTLEHVDATPNPGNNGQGIDQFCGNHIQTFDGNALFVGGTASYTPLFIGSRSIWEFDWRQSRWTSIGQTTAGRWYPSLIPIGDGRIMIVSGIDDGGQGTHISRIIESIDPVDNNKLDAYPRQGDNFAFGLMEQMFQRMGGQWDMYIRYVPHADGRYLLTGDGTGWGNRDSRNTVYLRFSPVGGPLTVTLNPGPDRGTTNKFYPTQLADPRPGKENEFLIMGGMERSDSLDIVANSNVATATTELSRYVPSQDSGTFNNEPNFLGAFVGGGGREDRRLNHEAVYLPTGDFMVVGGGHFGYTEPVFFPNLYRPDDELAAGDADRCDFGTGGGRPDRQRLNGFCRLIMAPHHFPRLYHTNAVLLPSGKVLLSGGNSGRASWIGRNPATRRLNLQNTRQNDPDRGDGTAANPNEDQYLEVYSPPYLFMNNRPEITNVSAREVDYGSTIAFDVSNGSDNGNGDKVTFIKLGSMTHSMDNGQRLANLQFQNNGGHVTATTPDAGRAELYPPGWYMMFYVSKNDQQGKVPSVGQLVRLKPSR